MNAHLVWSRRLGALYAQWVTSAQTPDARVVIAEVHLWLWARLRERSPAFGALIASGWASVIGTWPQPGGEA